MTINKSSMEPEIKGAVFIAFRDAPLQIHKRHIKNFSFITKLIKWSEIIYTCFQQDKEHCIPDTSLHADMVVKTLSLYLPPPKNIYQENGHF